MTLFSDVSYSNSFKDVISLSLEDTLFFQVDLQTANSFASDVMLQVDSCWATESTDPQDTVQGVLLQDGYSWTWLLSYSITRISFSVCWTFFTCFSCSEWQWWWMWLSHCSSCPVDNTFHWLSANGRAQSSRFSIQMFTMPRGQPLYISCLVNICGPDEDCTKVNVEELSITVTVTCFSVIWVVTDNYCMQMKQVVFSFVGPCLLTVCVLLIALVARVIELQQPAAHQEVSETCRQRGEACSCSVSWTSGGQHGEVRSPTIRLWVCVFVSYSVTICCWIFRWSWCCL